MESIDRLFIHKAHISLLCVIEPSAIDIKRSQKTWRRRPATSLCDGVLRSGWYFSYFDLISTKERSILDAMPHPYTSQKLFLYLLIWWVLSFSLVWLTVINYLVNRIHHIDNKKRERANFIERFRRTKFPHAFCWRSKKCHDLVFFLPCRQCPFFVYYLKRRSTTTQNEIGCWPASYNFFSIPFFRLIRRPRLKRRYVN